MLLRTTLYMLFFILNYINIVQAQKQSNIWYFGTYGTGLDFNYNPPKTLNNGKQDKAGMGLSCISNKKGRLLFYTNGIDIWDSLHNIMPNGSNMKGAAYINPYVKILSETMYGKLIVQQPDSQNKYFVFISDCCGRKNGLMYSVIDMKLNGGKGDVVNGKKSITLVSPIASPIAGVKHANGYDYWIVVQKLFSDTVMSFLLTSNGISDTPVISRLTTINYSKNKKDSAYHHVYQIKISPNGKKIFFTGVDSCSLADFNSQTGKIDNIWNFNYYYDSIYYGEFSPKSIFLYTSFVGKIMQYDLRANDKKSFISSKKRILGTLIPRDCILQLGADGKIYSIFYDNYDSLFYSYISVINAPDSIGIKCRTQIKYIYFSQKVQTVSFPNFISTYFWNNSFEVNKLCLKDTIFFYLKDKQYPRDSIKWIFNDSASGKSNISIKSDSVSHIFYKPGNYKVKLINYFGKLSDTITQILNIKDNIPYLGNDSIYCYPFFKLLKPNKKFIKYQWNTGEKMPSIFIWQPGSYILNATDSTGCQSSDTINIYQSEIKPQILLSDSTSCLKGNKFELKDKSTYTNDTYSKTLWHFGDSTFSSDSNTVKSYANSGVYKVKMYSFSKLGCIDSAEKEITVFAQNNIGFAVNDSIQCLNKNSFDFINTSPDTANITSFWDLGEQTLFSKTNIIDKIYQKDSTYLVKLFTQTNNGCKDTLEKQITILPAPQADFTTGITCSKTKTDFIFTGKKLTNTTFEWNFDNESKAYSENASYMFSNAGNKKVKLIVKADNNCNDTLIKTIEIKKQAKAEFEAKDVCENDSAVFINKSKDADEYLWKFGDGQYSKTVLAFGETRHKYQISKTTTFLVTLVAKSGCSDSVTNPITVNQNPNSDFTSTQNGDKLTLKAQSGYSNYKWKFNNKDSISVTTENHIHTLNNYTPIKICLQITDINNCTSQTCKTIPLGTNQTFKPQTFKLYPNPNSGTFTIESENPSHLTIQIFDVLGREVSFTIQPNIQTSNIQTIKLTANETRGIYFVKLKQNGVIWVERVLVGEN